MTSGSWCTTPSPRSSWPTASAPTTPGPSSTISSRNTRTARPPRCSSPPPPRERNASDSASASRGIGTTADFRAHASTFEAAGVDQFILLRQAGRNRHEHICHSLELLAAEVLPEFAARSAERERRKAEEVAPHIERALERKQRLAPLADADIPVVRACVAAPIVNR